MYDISDVKGAVTADGKAHYQETHDSVCAGANTAALFDLKDQLRPTKPRCTRTCPCYSTSKRGFLHGIRRRQSRAEDV
ncbi:hypothetical protein G647_04344 [Cladophialophora carrionii CBS 160.54]|uniref:Uncharacterized protein n=1 Tax=Cladophialophora carrionii CBS 160.54 TaxID=1279043 RepID=V9DDJ8_9EURO|nr:uncharacterized protein G647_04344 [Cladophialophora carrionii CBS 160.54]ETI24974.1 hypothetical protein G647_04344 [Cladophialophora carrionii CBS 160.54]